MNVDRKVSGAAERHQSSFHEGRHHSHRNSSMPITEAYKSLRLHGKYFILWIAFWILIAVLYLSFARPQFTASALIILNPSRQIVSGNAQSEAALPTLDSAQTESQMQVLKSERLLNTVYESLGLAAQSENLVQDSSISFFPIDLPPFGALKKTENGETRRRIAFQAFANRVNVRRIGQSYVLEVSYQSFVPQESARVANAISMQYIKSQIALKAASVQRGTEYLQGRIVSINNQLKAASEGVASGSIPDSQFPDADAQVISAAVEPLGKASPKGSLTLAIAITFGLVTGLTAIFWRNSLDKTLKYPEQITQGPNAADFGVLLRLRKSRGMVGADQLTRQDKVFSNLMTEIYLNTPTSGRRTIGVFSWSKGSGCTFVSKNLAQNVSSAGHRTTLVEVDPGLPPRDTVPSVEKDSMTRVEPSSVHGNFANPETLNVVSISDLSALDGLNSKGILQQQDTSNWWMLVDNMNIVIDFPSIETFPECLAVCDEIDCAVLVVEFGRTSVEQFEKSMSALSRAGARSIGVVINKAI